MLEIFLKKRVYEISHLVKKKELSVKEVVEFFLDRIKKIDSKLNAFLYVCEKEAILQAEEIQKKINSGELQNSKIAGIPIAIKDNIATYKIRTTCGSKILENWIPPYDATVIKRIKEAGGIIIGKTNLDEFAMGSSTENSAFFPTKNPWDLDRVPGGSSGGSASAVASLMVRLSLGSDTGGSIRQPAGFCGIVGLCPTYGRVSRFGLVAFASSLDRIGPFALYVDDVADILYHIAGYDELDSTSLDAPVPDYSKEIAVLENKNHKVKVGVIKDFVEADGVDKRVRDVIVSVANRLGREFGFELEYVSLPTSKYAVPIYYIIAPAEASSNLARYDGVKYGARDDSQELSEMYIRTRTNRFGDEVKRRIFIGTFVLSSGYYDAYYLKAQKSITLLRRDFDEIFRKVDVVICPTSPELPFKLGEKSQDPLKMYLSDVFTIPSSLAGLPAISVPAGFVEENGKPLPVGLQIIGKQFDEVSVLYVAKCVEKISGCAGKIPQDLI